MNDNQSVLNYIKQKIDKYEEERLLLGVRIEELYEVKHQLEREMDNTKE